MSATNSSAAQLAAINTTAARYGLSPSTLLGIFGTESAYGTNLGPSSAGAVGPFQFLPSTGSTYGLNSTTIMQFQPSLTAAAQYLKKLGANSSPTSPATFGALNAYNGNKSGTSASAYTNQVLSFGLSTANFNALVAKAEAPSAVGTALMTLLFGGGASSPTDIIGSVGGTGGTALANAVGANPNPISSVTEAIAWVFSNWLRILEFLGGAVLGIFGLVLLGKAGAKEA